MHLGFFVSSHFPTQHTNVLDCLPETPSLTVHLVCLAHLDALILLELKGLVVKCCCT